MFFKGTQRLQRPVLCLGAPLKISRTIFRRNLMHDHFLYDGIAPYIAVHLHPGIFGQRKESSSVFFLAILGRILLKLWMRKGNNWKCNFTFVILAHFPLFCSAHWKLTIGGHDENTCSCQKIKNNVQMRSALIVEEGNLFFSLWPLCLGFTANTLIS